jgi:hypothetical protein
LPFFNLSPSVPETYYRAIGPSYAVAMDATATDIPVDASAASEKKELDEKRTENNALASSRSSLTQKPEKSEKSEPLQHTAEDGGDQAKDIERDAGPVAERVVTTESARKRRLHHGHVNDISSVPNGGLRAWLQVAGSFVLFFHTW